MARRSVCIGDEAGCVHAVRMMAVIAVAATCASAVFASTDAEGDENVAKVLENVPAKVAKVLAEADVWIMPQPKEAAVGEGCFDLAGCRGIRIGGAISPKGAEVLADLPDLVAERSGVTLGMSLGEAEVGCVAFGVFPDGVPSPGFEDVSAKDLEGLGDEGYVLVINTDQITAAARETEGLYYAGRTLAQIATDRTELPCLKIRDWPSLRYRGAQQDISRGQVPTMDTFKRLVRLLAEGKANILELYIEHTFKWKSHADISPPEGIAPDEAREVFDYAARYGIEVHPILQVLGHSYHILHQPQYHHLRVGPCEKAPWIMTFDIRKGETIAFINDLVQEIVAAFPGKFLNVDITEVDVEGMNAAGMKTEDLPELVYQYVLKLRDMVRPHGIRLIIAQGPLDSTGHLSGMGPVLEKMPRDIIIGCYYTAGGGYQPAWKKDFPRLEKLGFDFFAQAWIGSHIRIMPPADHAAEFSDLEVSRGLAHGALGSITCDWGDAGNFHLTGQQWYPFLYHASSAWTGAEHDRGYFNQAFTRLLYGTAGDDVARAFEMASNISQQKVKVRNEDGKVVEQASYHFYEFMGNPFSDKRITDLADPLAEGAEILEPADEAVLLLKEALAKATRNRDNIEQLLFGARCYQAMGRKLVVVGRCRDEAYPRDLLIKELDELAATYTRLQEDFRRLWLAEDRENDNFHSVADRFNHTIAPCRRKIDELKKAAGK